MTRRLVASGQRPVTVGTFFSLGHSTYDCFHPESLSSQKRLLTHLRIVIVTSIVVAATAAAVSRKFSAFSRVGEIIGSSVSAAFLLILGIVNSYILLLLILQMRRLLRANREEQTKWKLEGGGCLFRVLKKLYRLVDK